MSSGPGKPGMMRAQRSLLGDSGEDAGEVPGERRLGGWMEMTEVGIQNGEKSVRKYS